jgi:hypothetical protein
MEVHSCPQKTLILQRAVAANNLGVAYAASKNDLSKALASFRDALIGIKASQPEGAQAADHLYSVQQDDAHTYSIPSQVISQGNHSSLLSLKKHVLEAIAGASPAPSPSCTTSSLPLAGPVLCRPFSIPDPYQATGTENAGIPPFYFCFERGVDDSLLCTVILFNLAVSTHAMLILGKDHQEHEDVPAYHARVGGLRKRAKALYRSCSQLMINACGQIEHALLLSPSSNGSAPYEQSVPPRVPNIIFAWIDVMRMTLLNNQAQLEIDSGNQGLAFVRITPALEVATNVSLSSQERYGDQSLSTVVKTMANFLVDSYVSADSRGGCAASA